MKTLALFPLLAVVALVGCGKPAQQAAGKAGSSTAAKQTNAAAAEQSKESSLSGNPITAPVDYLGALGRAKKVAEKTVDVATLNRAVETFNAGEGRNPKDLNELVKEGYLPRLPDAPYGMKILYNPQTGKVKVVQQQ